jgi:transcriptional regulator with XRE-family HTH domain
VSRSTADAEALNDEIETIGQRIRTTRKRLGLNQGALADRLGVTQPTVANWEAGVHDPRQLMLAKLAEALGVSLGWLAGGERSDRERDRSATAPYVRRPIQHVPVLTPEAAVRMACGTPDPHDMATDYVPVTYGGGRLAAVFLPEDAVPPGFAPDTLFVIDYDRTRPTEGELVLLRHEGRVLARAWRGSLGGRAAGTVIASIRFH